MQPRKARRAEPGSARRGCSVCIESLRRNDNIEVVQPGGGLARLSEEGKEASATAETEAAGN